MSTRHRGITTERALSEDEEMGADDTETTAEWLARRTGVSVGEAARRLGVRPPAPAVDTITAEQCWREMVGPFAVGRVG